MSDSSFDVAIIGGGIIGTAIAYHLAKKGVSSVAVVEKQSALGLGSTAKAAGGIRAQFRSDINIELSKISIEHFERFPKEMGVEVLFQQAGYLWLATTAEQMKVFRENVERQRRHGLDVKILTPDEIAAKAPFLNMQDVVGATFHQRDGYAPPADYVAGYEKRAREMGAAFLTGSEVTDVLQQGNTVTGLATTTGEVRARKVVCAAGAWIGQIGKMVGVDIPVKPVRRQCFVTEPIDTLPHPIPMIVDHGSGVYMHSESGGLLIGMADKKEPPSFNETMDYKFVEKVAELAMHRLPALAEAGMKTGWGGLYAETPDHHPILGPLPGRPGLWCCAGFSGHGFMHAPAAAMLMAEWIVDGKPSLDLSPLSYSRFQDKRLVDESHVI